MRPAGGFAHAPAGVKGIEAGIAVSLQDAGKALQMRLRALAAPVG